jgi:ubiquinone/menaquinone biosynthesis C-methylase UbiE
MVGVLNQAEFEITSAKRILEFGCASARMCRHLPELVPGTELWGVDVSADHIRWCIDHLSPLINFATCTFVPHLPFEDRYFDFIFAGSVFTHIEDTQEAWLLELGRILRPGGKLYLTIHDENTVRILESQYPDLWLTKWLVAQPFYRQCADSFEIIVVNRGSQSQVFYRTTYFRHIVPCVFRWLSHTPEMYAYQSAVLLEKVG